MTLLPFLFLAVAIPQDAPLIRSAFVGSEEGWNTTRILGTGGKLAVVHDAEHLKVGIGSLKFEYAVKPGEMTGATLPVASGVVAKMGSIHFWVRPDQNTPLVVSLVEGGGAQYTCMVSAAKGKWQEVELGVEDFVQSQDAGALADVNDRLDLDGIAAITVVDLDQFLGQNQPIAELLGVQQGTRTLYLSDFKVTTKPLPSTVTGGEYVIDAFARPQPTWAVLNAASSIVNEAPLSTRALRMDYNLPSGKATGAIKSLRLGSLVGKKSLAFRLATANAAQLVVQVEEKGGGKYNFAQKMPGGSAVVDRSVEFSDFTPAEDSKDDNNKLDLDQVKQITIIDLTALLDAPGRNTLWVGRIAARA